jgi:hypothetical protein
MMEGLPGIMAAAHHAANVGLKQDRDKGRLTKKEFEAEQQKQQRQLNELKALKLEKVTELVRRLYGDAVRVKVVPDPQRAANAFVGSANLACFHDSAASLAQKYGYEIDAAGPCSDKSTCRLLRPRRRPYPPATTWRTPSRRWRSV